MKFNRSIVLPRQMFFWKKILGFHFWSQKYLGFSWHQQVGGRGSKISLTSFESSKKKYFEFQFMWKKYLGLTKTCAPHNISHCLTECLSSVYKTQAILEIFIYIPEKLYIWWVLWLCPQYTYAHLHQNDLYHL